MNARLRRRTHGQRRSDGGSCGRSAALKEAASFEDRIRRGRVEEASRRPAGEADRADREGTALVEQEAMFS